MVTICSAVAAPMPGQRAQPLHILTRDRIGDFLHRPGHCLERFLDADLLHGAEEIEEIQFGFGKEADEARDEAIAARRAFQVFADVKGDLFAGPHLHVTRERLRRRAAGIRWGRPAGAASSSSTRVRHAGHLGDHADNLQTQTSSIVYRPAVLWAGISRPHGASGIAVPAVPLVYEFHRFAERAEDDRVFADVVAGPDGVDADLLRRAFADHAFASTSSTPSGTPSTWCRAASSNASPASNASA